jgi:hypothetical protein
MWVKRFLMWFTLLVVFDGTACAALRAMLDQPLALTMEAPTPVACDLDSHVHGGMSIDDLNDLQDELCPAPSANAGLSDPERTGN